MEEKAIRSGLDNGTDAVTHFVIAYALLTEAIGHHQLLLVESVSLACAVVSTLLAVSGELLSQLKIHRASKRRDEKAEKEKIA